MLGLMEFNYDFSLKNYNTFGIEERCDAFVQVNSEESLLEAIKHNPFNRVFVLGQGSNILLTQKISGLCIHVGMKGISLVSETDEEVIVEAMAGENWHQLVVWSLEQGYGGLENLALIPGNVGTAPIQNIGAYGVELKDIFVSCTALDLNALTTKTFDVTEVGFGYRNSIFKTKAKGKYIITRVRFRLTKRNHRLHTQYGAIKNALAAKEPNPKNIAEAVIGIRKSKLPDPKELGNSGSFFKNPVIKKTHFEKLQTDYPELPFYVQENGDYKIPAGWLIEFIGFKGYRINDAGVHSKQALVLVNHGSANGKEILALANEIQNKIFETFQIQLETEVNIL